MWCLWALPLLGLAVRVSSEESPTVYCNDTLPLFKPPLWVKMYKDEAHFACSPGFKLLGQKILTCINGIKWSPHYPECAKLPTVMIKMKCPFDHREWTLSNLNLISSWIDQNVDQVLILNSDFIEDSPESQRLAAEMLARFNDPFFRFYANLPTADKGMPMERLIRRFQESKQFLALRNKRREDVAEFDSNDIDEDQNVLLSYYGLYYQDVFKDIIQPYNGLITEQPQTDTPPEVLSAAKLMKTQRPPVPLVPSLSEEIGTSPPFFEDPHTNFPDLQVSHEYGFSAEFASLETTGGGEAAGPESPKKNVKRDKGDLEKFLPPRVEGQDFFHRPNVQPLIGEKAQAQVRQHRESYFEYLKTIVKHIVDYNIPREKWPEFLRKYDLEELIIVLEIPTPSIPENPECPPPWRLGFDLVSHGTAMLEGTKKVIIRCNPGYQLRGASELYCDRGRWVPRGAGMPTCISVSEEPRCDSQYAPRVANGRVLKADVNYVIYECLPGYSLGTTTNMLLCKNGTWAPGSGDSMPVCRETPVSNNCGPPPTPANGRASEPHFMTDGRRYVVRYFCNANYSMTGEDYSMCVNGKWTPYTFRCTLNGIDDVPSNTELPQEPKVCGKVVVANAAVKYYEDGTSTVRVTCLPGYRMVGVSLIRCQDGLYIDPFPTCVDRGAGAEACGPAVAPLHGNVEYITANAVRFSCDAGYTIRGRDRATCYRGQWSDPTPSCVSRAGCDNSDQISNKNLVGYVYNNGRWLECAQRNEMFGNHHQFCRDGRWDPEPTCVSSENQTSILYSEFIDCPLPEAPVSNGITISSRGRKIYYRCKFQDSTLRGEMTNECVAGRWLHAAPYCERRGVVYPPSPTSAPTRAPTRAPFRGCQAIPIRGGEGYIYSEGRVVIYQCKRTYFIRGATTLRCERSQWSSPLPACYDSVQSLIQEDGEIYSDGQYCPQPPQFPGTTSVIMNRGLRIYFRCPNGSLTIHNCIDGRWSGDTPPCSLTGVCEPQEIENGKFFQYRRGVGTIQCKGNYIIQGTVSSRSIDVNCNPDDGQWSFGLIPPKCVPEPVDADDNRPFNDADDSKWDSRLQVDDCGPPEVSSKFTFYIQKDGRSVALGCKKPRTKRNVGSISCTNGSWSFAATDICGSDCGLKDVRIDNGVKVIYDENEYVFQCAKNYELIGAPVAHCAGFLPSGSYNTSFVQQFGPDFKVPECRRTEVEVRPISADDVLDADASQPCRWLAEFGKLYLRPKDFFISDRGKVVTWKHDGKEDTAVCQNGMWVSKASQTRGCDSLPSEPDQGTFFLYEDSRGVSVYFQCLDGYRLSGPRVGFCSSSRVPVPDCILDASATRGVYAKVKNPNPGNTVRCPRPPENLQNAEISIHRSGEMYVINCYPGFSIENTGQRYSIVRCNQYANTQAWDPEPLPRCLRDGDRTPLTTPRPGSRRDLFGRPLPQELTGEKAARQDAQLQLQFRQHAQQLVEFAKARNRELRRSGVPRERLPIDRLPIVSTITDGERDELFRKNEATYREIESLLATIREERINRQRRNHLKTHFPESDAKVPIPSKLLHLEAIIKPLNLTQEDYNILVILEDSDRLKYLEDKKVQQEKSKSDPARSHNFVRKAMADKAKFVRKNSAEDVQVKSAEMDNSIDSSTTEFSSVSSSTEATSTPAAVTATTEGTTPAETGAPEEVTETSTELPQETSSMAEDGILPKVNESAVTETVNNPSSKRKGFDDSCSQQFAKAPEIKNGFIVSYEVFESAEGKSLQARYRCFEGYDFEYEYTQKVRCRDGKWIGELPTCVPDPEDEDEDEDPDEESDSHLNKLK